jgi:mono/diheme cytochrome c family protein
LRIFIKFLPTGAAATEPGKACGIVKVMGKYNSSEMESTAVEKKVYKKTTLFGLVVSLLVLFACERSSVPYGSKSAPDQGEPVYNVHASVSAVPNVALIRDVLPQGDEGIDGQALYTQCAACHQITGQGIPGAFPPLDGSSYVTSEKTDRLAAIMIYGLSGPIKVKGMTYNGVMTPMGAIFNDEQLAAVASYIRGAWSNKAKPVSQDVFKTARAKWGARGPMTIAELGGDEE